MPYKKLKKLSTSSTKGEETPYTMEDFEKGLMLAGLLRPNSIQELNEREQVEKYESENVANAKPIYFKRVVLAAEIVAKLHTEPSLGKVKFQKLVFLCEHVAGMELTERYTKQAAGPFDNKFMHSVGKEFKKNNWFSIEQTFTDNYTRYKFLPMENMEGYKHYYDNYFKDVDDKIQYIIELFRKQKTDQTELAATVFACTLELSAQQSSINKDTLLELFYDWSEGKKRFTPTDVLASYDWLQKVGIIAKA
ncbi:type I restriction enzyme, S subunit [Mucilaginibacter sp. OK268]|nr:type I restriction enzyme, S subunit [Mucilaginibacter sp. OK268]